MLVTLATRGAQIVLCVVSLILSIVLITDFGPGRNPALINYGAFCGACGLLFSIIGIGALFFDVFQGIVILALDGVATFFLLAGALAFAIKVKVGDCGDTSNDGYLSRHTDIFSPNPLKFQNDVNNDGKLIPEITSDLIYRCRLVQANTALIWFMFGTFLVTLALSFANKSTKRGGGLM